MTGRPAEPDAPVDEGPVSRARPARPVHGGAGRAVLPGPVFLTASRTRVVPLRASRTGPGSTGGAAPAGSAGFPGHARSAGAGRSRGGPGRPLPCAGRCGVRVGARAVRARAGVRGPGRRDGGSRCGHVRSGVRASGGRRGGCRCGRARSGWRDGGRCRGGAGGRGPVWQDGGRCRGGRAWAGAAGPRRLPVRGAGVRGRVGAARRRPGARAGLLGPGRRYGGRRPGRRGRAVGVRCTGAPARVARSRGLPAPQGPLPPSRSPNSSRS